jgi:flavin reductase (DIM6/NTAB) family NADH-FMN oxidoreductase RutF
VLILEKVEVGEGVFHKFFYPRPTLLLSTMYNDKANLTAVDWTTPLSITPPLLCIALNKNSMSLDFIGRTKEFVVAVPTPEMKGAVAICGSTSGKFLDKFAESGLEGEKARSVGALLVKGAVANFECKCQNITNAGGDHTLVTGEVVDAHFDSKDVAGAAILSGDAKDLFVWEPQLQKQEKPQ